MPKIIELKDNEDEKYYMSNIVEKIKNENGIAIKYADGTMVCYGNITVGVSGGHDYYQLFNVTNQTSITFPASFVNTDNLSCLVNSQQFGVFSAIITSISESGLTFRGFYSPQVTFTSMHVNYIAIGKWR